MSNPDFFVKIRIVDLIYSKYYSNVTEESKSKELNHLGEVLCNNANISTSSHYHSKIAITIGAVVILGLGYAGMAYHYKSSSTFMPNTTVAGTNVGGKNATQAQQLIEKHLSNQKLN